MYYEEVRRFLLGVIVSAGVEQELVLMLLSNVWYLEAG